MKPKVNVHPARRRATDPELPDIEVPEEDYELEYEDSSLESLSSEVPAVWSERRC